MRQIGWLVLTGLVLGIFACRGAGKPNQLLSNYAPAMQAQQSVQRECVTQGVNYPPKRVFLRAFKQERELELWGANTTGEFRLIHIYSIAAASGVPGPKRREGDLQVPEGVYQIAKFNPKSRFHLSMGLNYPNSSDRILGIKDHLGGDIYIHGNHVSAGCLAMTDPKIEEIYDLAFQARRPIAVHVFPCRMDTETYRDLKRKFPSLTPFWSQLEPIYASFQVKRVIPRVKVTRDGSYVCLS